MFRTIILYTRIIHYLCPFIELVEVIGRVSDFVRHESEPRDHIVNSGEELLLLFLRIRVVVTQKANSFVVTRVTKVDVNGFGVTHVQNTVGLGRKPRAHLSST